jgi:hypothetical protein
MNGKSVRPTATKNLPTFTFTSYGEVILMDRASLAVIIVGVVLVLQIVSLVLIAGMRKAVRALKEVRVAPAAPAERFERKNNDFRRQEKRPFPDQRPRHQPQAQPAPQAAPAPAIAVDPVEKSLRDINMRLKNAERDQEFARKKIQENFNRGDQPRNRDGGGDRGDHRGGRGGRDRHRGGGRDHRRDNWQDRNREPQSQQSFAETAAPSSNEQPTFEKREYVPGTQPEMHVAPQYEPQRPAPIMEPVAVSASTGPDIVPTDFGSNENIEHGRKVMINRRPLKNETPESTGGAPEAQASSPEVGGAVSTPINADATSTGSSEESTAEITFGRRKG